MLNNLVLAKFVLITSLYNETNNVRIQEYITCIEKNLEHPMIGLIHVLYDTSHDNADNRILNFLKTKNIEIHYLSGRPTFGNCFDLANSLQGRQKIIISNADIYFNESLDNLDSYDLQDKFLALTRWNIESDGQLNLFWLHDQNGHFRQQWQEHSQDAWIFATPLRKFNDDIDVGTDHCDSRLAYEAYASGLKVLNPCLTIQCCHLHLSGIRHYTYQKMENKCRKVPWTKLK